MKHQNRFLQRAAVLTLSCCLAAPAAVFAQETQPETPASVSFSADEKDGPYLENGQWILYDHGNVVLSKWYYGRLDTDQQAWYYFDAAGRMATGWKLLPMGTAKEWFFFNDQGVMQTGWQKIDGETYYFKADGAMKTGWLSEKKDGKTYWYFLDQSGHMKTGWLRLLYGSMAAGTPEHERPRSRWHYLQSDGVMLANTQMGIYRFDSAGFCLNPDA